MPGYYTDHAPVEKNIILTWVYYTMISTFNERIGK